MGNIDLLKQNSDDEFKRAILEMHDSIELFGKYCFPTAFTKKTPSAHREIFECIVNEDIKRLLIAAPRGFAKAQALESKVMTPNGWKLFGDLEVGDEVIGSDGNPTKVTHLHPIGRMNLYKVTTRDGRSALCNAEHLWKVSIPQWKYKIPVVRTTRSLIPIFGRDRIDNRNGELYKENPVFIDTVKPIAFSEKDLPVDPYTLGCWLGDGHSAGARFTTVDTEILGYIPYKSRKTSGKYLYQIYGLHKTLRLNNLLNNKHIPEQYLLAGIKQREALLQGLMDTDGTISENTYGIATFCQKSERLIDSVVELVRSLGGTAHKSAQWTRANVNSEYKKSFRALIRLPEEVIPFRLKRKRDLWTPSRTTKSSIVDISYSHVGFGRCITVEAKDGLYITNDYLVTHNSTIMTFLLPVWKVAFKKSSEDLFIVIISESQAQSINFLSRIRFHFENSRSFRALFGDFGPATARRWTTTDVVFKNGARIVAVGCGQRVRGFIEGDTRPNLIIVDDYESELNAGTKEMRAKNKKWVTEAVIPSLSDDGRIIMIGTVISEDCFLYWARKSSAWHVLWYKIIDDNGDSLWIEKFPLSRIKQIKEEFASVGNLNGFYQEYMNEAQSPDEAPFKPHYMHLHHYDYKVINGQQCLYRVIDDKEIIIPVTLYSGVDPASSLSLRADFFVIATLGIDNDNNVYIVDMFRQRIDPAKQPRVIIDKYKKFRPRWMKIETVAYQEALRSAVRDIMQREDLYIPGLEKGVKPRNPKSERLLSLVPMMARGKFFFRDEDIEVQSEFLSYPKGKNDDCLDAIWTALEHARPCRVKELDKAHTKDERKKILFDWMCM